MNSVDIANEALLKNGYPKIVSFGDANNSAVIARCLYERCRDRILRKHVWNFALEIQALNQLSSVSGVEGYPVACAFPGNMLRMVRLESREPYLLMGNVIYVRELPQNAVFVKRIDDPGMFDPAFTDCLVSLMASEIALSDGNGNRASYFRQEYQDAIRDAKSINSIENVSLFQRGERRSRWIAARRGGHA